MPKKRRHKSRNPFDMMSPGNWAVFGLFSLVIGVPLLLALFSEDGPFNELVELPSQGTLANNPYATIMVAIILFLPLIVVAGFVFKRLMQPSNSRPKKTPATARKTKPVSDRNIFKFNNDRRGQAVRKGGRQSSLRGPQ